MIKENKWKVIISNIIILLPIIFGLLFWNELPDRMATHWGIGGNADGWSNKAFAVFFMPLLLLVFHWVCIIIVNHDYKNKGQSSKIFNLTFFIMPIVSLFSSVIVYGSAFDMDIQVDFFMPVFLGLLFIIIGNYLPKCRQNYTIGIKVPWTYSSEENWNKTHRMGGIMYVVCGALMMLTAFLPTNPGIFTMTFLLIIMAVAPIVYSYVLYRKQIKDKNPDFDEADEKEKEAKKSKRANIIYYGFAAVIIAAAIILMNIDGYNIRYDDTSFSIETALWSNLTVDYAAIESIEYRSDCDSGVRTYGFGSGKMLMGTFRNDEFGKYTRYSHTYCDSCVLLTINGEILVIGKEDEESTKAVYNELLSRING